MKHLLFSFIAVIAQAAEAQFSIDWFKVADGGGTSAGIGYAVNGTIGQADCFDMTDSKFSLVGGFWSLIAPVPTGTPTLTIRLTATNTLLICWPSNSTEFVLQENADLRTTNWFSVAQTPTDDGYIKCIATDLAAHSRFYRLKKYTEIHP